MVVLVGGVMVVLVGCHGGVGRSCHGDVDKTCHDDVRLIGSSCNDDVVNTIVMVMLVRLVRFCC